jgi:predicted transcriptional regulator of viral defense system
MHDQMDDFRLYRIAESQAGYFTAQQAVEAGMTRSTLSHHARRGGRYERVAWGVYRLRQFPTSPHEHVVAAWLSLRDPRAVVSHQSALELHELSDVVADEVHLTVGRTGRWRGGRRGIRLHFPTKPIPASDRITVMGLPVTSVERTIADHAQEGGQPEQVELAVAEALARGLTTRRRLRTATEDRSARVRAALERALDLAP